MLETVSSHSPFSFPAPNKPTYLLQTSVLLDEAKIREDARNVQHKCLEKEFTALKEENKTVSLSTGTSVVQSDVT